MAKKRKAKYSIKQIVIYTIVVIGIILGGIFVDNTKENSHLEILNDGHFKVYGIVEKLRPRSLKGKGLVSRKDVVYLYFTQNDTVYHLIKDLPDRQIEKLGIKRNDCFEVRIAKSDNDIFEIDFSKKLDTFFNKNNYRHQVYKTDVHKNLIE